MADAQKDKQAVVQEAHLVDTFRKSSLREETGQKCRIGQANQNLFSPPSRPA